MRYRLYDAAAGGLQIGSTLGLNAATVSRGQCTVILDCGGGAFDGTARWLEIEVAVPADSGNWSTLTP